MTISVEFTLNGRPRRVEMDAQRTLTEVLREDLFLTGTKEGCGVGECGACVVLVDDAPVVSCLVLAANVDGSRVETVEGLAEDGGLTSLQQAFIDRGAFQCGFCTPAMVLTATAALRNGAIPDLPEMRAALGGILCRCGAYPKILEAIAAVTGGES